MKWEYKIIKVPVDTTTKAEKLLNVLGENGWEAVSSMFEKTPASIFNYHLTATLKRLKT